MQPAGGLRFIRTSRHIRTMRSIHKSTTEGRDGWPRLQDTERQGRELARLRARRAFEGQRRGRRRSLVWP
jgi:hypothetical protein